jgi:hypothetical protein
MNRTGINGSGSGIRRLPRAAWPKPIRLAWDAAATTRRGRRRSPATYLSYDASVGVYLWFLQSGGLLDPDAPLAEQVTPERLDDYFGCLLGNGNSPYTIEGRFRQLRAALQMMHPGGEFGFVTRPDGIPLQQTMEMRRRVLFVPDSRHLVFLGGGVVPRRPRPAGGDPPAAASPRCRHDRDFRRIGTAGAGNARPSGWAAISCATMRNGSCGRTGRS